MKQGVLYLSALLASLFSLPAILLSRLDKGLKLSLVVAGMGVLVGVS